MTDSQRDARDLESARQLYVAAIGTPYEAQARALYERELERVRWNAATRRPQ